MSKLDLKGLKAADLNALKKQNEENSQSRESGAGIITLKDAGTHTLRIFPSHPDTIDTYSMKRRQAWVPYMNKEGKQTAAPVLNAKDHGDQDKDIIEEYVKLAANSIKAARGLSSADKGKKLDALYDRQKGLKFKIDWLAYGKEFKGEDVNRGLIEYSHGVQKDWENLSLAEYEEDPTAPDPISDPIEGFKVIVKTNPDSKSPNDYYTSNLSRASVSLEQEDIDWLMEQKPLVELLENVYHAGMFERAMKGLEIYDEQHEIGVFRTDEFQDIAEQIKAKLPAAPERDGEDGGNEAGDAFLAGSKQLEEMDRAELKQWIIDNEVDIKVTRKMDEEAILDAIEEAFDGELPELPIKPKKPKLKAMGEEEGDDDEEESPAHPFKDKTDLEEEAEEEEEEEAPARRTRRSRRGS